MKDPYYGLDLLSNSRLGVVYNLIHGLPLMKAKKETLDFGTQLHEAVLEPEKYKIHLQLYPDLYKPNYHKIKNMVAGARKNSLLMYLLMQPGCRKERDVYPIQHDRTGVNIKLKLDISLGSTIADLKTTTAQTDEDFLAACVAYHYFRQAAFYLDFTGAEKFIFFGISKKEPHQTFTKKYLIDDPEIIQGRAEYEDLIDHYLRLKSEGVDFQNLMLAA